MKKILISLTALGLIAGAAAPAAAQPWRDAQHDNYRGDRGNNYRGGHSRLTTSYVDGLEWKINNAAQEGRISNGERRELLREFRSVQPIAWRVQTGEARRGEAARLEQTVERIESAVNRRGGYARYGDRGERYGYRR